MGNKYKTLEQTKLLEFIRFNYDDIEGYVKGLNSNAIIKCLEIFGVNVKIGLDKKTLRGIYVLVIRDYMKLMSN